MPTWDGQAQERWVAIKVLCLRGRASDKRMFRTERRAQPPNLICVANLGDGLFTRPECAGLRVSAEQSESSFGQLGVELVRSLVAGSCALE